jgi:dihydrofolate reductase
MLVSIWPVPVRRPFEPGQPSQERNTRMRKVVSHLIVTLDGVVEFEAVADRIEKLRDTREVLADFFARVAEEDAMLLGRVTYQQWADYWPTSTDEPFATHINSVPKYVASRSLSSVAWGTRGHATLLEGDLAEGIRALKARPGKNIGVHGSPSLVESLLRADVLDELRLEVFPVIAGSGARLFKDGGAPKQVQLVDSKTTSQGVVILTYRRLDRP